MDVLASATQTFNIPYRPSAAAVASPGHCASGTTNWSGYTNDGTQWYDATDGNCYFGINYTATFNFNVTLPSTVVYGISYNTNQTDPSVAANSPMNSLNVEESIEPTNVTVGSDTDPGNVFASGVSGNDVGGSGGEVTCSTVGTNFEQYSTAVDPHSGCGETTSLTPTYASVSFVPAVQFNAKANGFISLLPGGPGQSIDFSINNGTSSPAYVQAVTVAVATDPGTGYVETTAGNTGTDVTGCYGSWFKVVQPSTPLDLTIPAGLTSFQPSGAAVSLINEPINQDACAGVVLALTFSSN
jgi:hypothetical protein